MTSVCLFFSLLLGYGAGIELEASHHCNINLKSSPYTYREELDEQPYRTSFHFQPQETWTTGTYLQ